jgi:mono/diheme cytochrome c family protein
MHRKNLSWLLVAAALAVAGTCVAADTSTSRVANGKRLFLADGCFECHGRVGEGGAFNGPAPALAGIFSRRSSIEIIAAVRKGPNDMPAYTEKVLSNQELGDIIAYIRSLSGPTDPKKYPLLYK